MRAMYYEQFGATPRIEQLPDPEPSPGGVVLRVEATGLCRSDWHGWMGHDADIRLPHVPGHELAGEVVETGAEVKHWKRGDRVTVPFVGGCGRCPICLSGNQQVCPDQFQPGFTHWGSFAEYVAIAYADTNLVALPPELASESAAALGCRVATAFRAVVDQGKLRPGEWVAVQGCGGVGLSAIMIAQALGARVMAVDIDPEKLQVARSLGAEILIQVTDDRKVVEEIVDHSEGGVHLSIDAFGHPGLIRQSIYCLRRRGRHVQVGLLDPAAGPPVVPMDRIIAWELELYGSHGMQAWRYPEMLGMILQGQLEPGRLIRKHITLEDAIPALMHMDRFEGWGVQVIRPNKEP